VLLLKENSSSVTASHRYIILKFRELSEYYLERQSFDTRMDKLARQDCPVCPPAISDSVNSGWNSALWSPHSPLAHRCCARFDSGYWWSVVTAATTPINSSCMTQATASTTLMAAALPH